ncbi:MAG: hypothetical protein LBC96_02590 [Lachnospiraceae bacterium]|nr:hypothetical protein [Lachnospiraceae bacterium]
MDTGKAIDFLLEHGSDIIKYRLYKEILKDKSEEERFLEKILETPRFILVNEYQKENGYIGISMHGMDSLKQTPLQDGETAARLLCNYSIPKESRIVRRFIEALTNEQILEKEFSTNKPETVRFKERFVGNGCGWGLQLLIDTCIAIMGYGDEYCQSFIETSLKAFNNVLSASSIMDIAKYNPESKKKYNYPYLEHDQLWPCLYHLETLAFTHSWRNEEAKSQLANAINHLNKITPNNSSHHIRLGSRYYSPCGGFNYPLKPYSNTYQEQICCNRRVLTHIALCGIGKNVEVAKQNAEILDGFLRKDGMISYKFKSSYEKRVFKQSLMYTGAYCEAGFSSGDYKEDIEIVVDLTFWAVHFLHNYE